MKTLLASTVIIAASLGTASAFAAAGHDGHAMATQASASNQMQMIDADVKKVDKSAGKVTLAHGPLVNLNMPAMTMVLRVKEPAWLDQMKAGDKIRFMAEKIDGAITVVHFEPAK